MKNYLIAGVLFLILAVSSFFLPTSVMKWQDEQRTRESETEEVQEVVLKEQISMTLTQKLNFREQETSNALELVNGKNYNKDTVEEHMRKEIEILAQQGILIDFDMEALNFESTSILFFVDTEDSERSIMLWDGYASTGKYSLSFQMDDETGKIVSFIQVAHNPYEFVDTDVSSTVGVSAVYSSWGVGTEELREMAEGWGEYLGCRVTDCHSAWMDINFGYDEGQFNKRIEAMMKKGYSFEEAEYMVALELGVDPWETEQMLAVLEDEGGQIGYSFFPEGEVIRVEPYTI